MKTVFVDSSVLFTAVNSPIGGSAKLFTLTNIKLVTSKVVLTEVERNARKKLEEYHLARFFHLVEKLYILPQSPNKILIQKAKKVIVEKDAVILSEAKQSQADILATLDRKHFFTLPVIRFFAPHKIQTPKMILDSNS